VKWKQFLKPDWRKIVIFVILFITTNLFLEGYPHLIFTAVNMSYGPWPVKKGGYPFTFLFRVSHFLDYPLSDYKNASNLFPVGTITIQKSSTSILGLNIPQFLIDTIIWYLLSCLIIWIYDKYKKKK